ncbi:MAG: hypothetical protein SFU27_11790 [Thermonemataceae bacterium]|nr:hypothetical protein [Thermonemataceae bacterium]
MKRSMLSLIFIAFSFISFAQTQVEGKIKAFTMETITITLNDSPAVSLKGKNVTVIKKFNLSETFPNMKGEGTMALAEGVVSQQNGNVVVVKVSKYNATKVENGVKKPMVKIGNKAILKY